MSRGDGFPRADIDVGILDDAKIRRLMRATKDPVLVNACIVGFVAVVTRSWGQGERVSLEEAAPAWLEDVDAIAARLAEFDLLDATGRILEHAWESWYGPARDRREQAREDGREGNRRRWGADRDPIGERSGGDRDPMRERSPYLPKVPTGRPAVPARRTGRPTDTLRARENGGAAPGTAAPPASSVDPRDDVDAYNRELAEELERKAHESYLRDQSDRG